MRGHEKIATAQKAEQRFPRDRKHVLAPQPAPDRFELADPFEGRVASIVCTVERADAGAEHHVGDDAVRREGMKHADLDGAKAAAAREHKSCLRLTLVRHHAILARMATLHNRLDMRTAFAAIALVIVALPLPASPGAAQPADMILVKGKIL